MEFVPTSIEGVVVIVTQRHADDRGSFARTFSRDAFMEHGLAAEFVQSSNSFTKRAGTLRGMHMQLPPHGEAKLVRCIRGAIHDVVCDLRASSDTLCRHLSFELSQGDGRLLYIPPGCAHGFQTLSDDVEVTYAMSTPFVPEAATGLRYDDPAFAIAWPRAVSSISEKDLLWQPYASWKATTEI